MFSLHRGEVRPSEVLCPRLYGAKPRTQMSSSLIQYSFHSRALTHLSSAIFRTSVTNTAGQPDSTEKKRKREKGCVIIGTQVEMPEHSWDQRRTQVSRHSPPHQHLGVPLSVSLLLSPRGLESRGKRPQNRQAVWIFRGR